MITRHRTPLGAFAAAAGVVLAVLLVATPASAAPAPSPQLSIAVENDRTALSPGDTVDYTVTVQNLGTTEVKALRVTQSVPAGLKFESADRSARTGADGITWQVNLNENDKATMRSTMTVVETPPDVIRVATVACARTSQDDPPIVCATHSARLPAAATSATQSAASAPKGFDSMYLIAGAAVLAVVAALAVLLVYRRRRRVRSDATTD